LLNLELVLVLRQHFLCFLPLENIADIDWKEVND